MIQFLCQFPRGTKINIKLSATLFWPVAVLSAVLLKTIEQPVRADETVRNKVEGCYQLPMCPNRMNLTLMKCLS